MTKNQKFVANKLLEGYYLVKAGSYWYRLRSPDHVVVRKITDKSFKAFNKLMRWKGNQLLLNKSLVRQLHGNHYLKQLYKTKMSTHVSNRSTNNSLSTAEHLPAGS